MPAPLIIPFDNNPSTIAVKTGSYTIPAGKYAKITITDMTSVFTIDAVTAFESLVKASTGTTASSAVNEVILTGEAGEILVGVFKVRKNGSGSPGILEGRIFKQGEGFLTDESVGNDIFGISSSTAPTVIGNHFRASQTVEIYPEDTLVVTSSAGEPAHWEYEFTIKNSVMPEPFWVPTGTVLVGAKYLVAEYNVIT